MWSTPTSRRRDGSRRAPGRRAGRARRSTRRGARGCRPRGPGPVGLEAGGRTLAEGREVEVGHVVDPVEHRAREPRVRPCGPRGEDAGALRPAGSTAGPPDEEDPHSGAAARVGEPGAEAVREPGVAQGVGAPRAGVLDEEEAAHGRGRAGEVVGALQAVGGAPEAGHRTTSSRPSRTSRRLSTRALAGSSGRSPGVARCGRPRPRATHGSVPGRAAPGRRGAPGACRRRRGSGTGGRCGGAAPCRRQVAGERLAVEQRPGQARRALREEPHDCSSATAGASRRRTASASAWTCPASSSVSRSGSSR